MEGFDFVHRETVRFRDVDAMGHVNNAVFLTYLEEARIAYLLPFGAEVEHMILARVEIDFRAPLRTGDELEIGVRPTSVGTKSFGLEYEVRCRGHGRGRGEDGHRLLRLRVRPFGRSAAGVAGGARRLMGVFERQTLPSGLRLLTAPMDHAQSVSCFIMLSAGSRFETPDTSGIAHFAEHMFFKGTESRPTARDIGGEIDGIGGEFNAFTGKEYTGYYVRCAGEHRSIALDVLVDMLRHSKFDSEEIEREKGVIVEEMNMYFDTPRDYISGVYDSLLYGDQPLGWDIIGRKETVRAATRDTFLGYIDRWYKPERMVVGIAGKIGDDLEAEVERLLGDLEPAETDTPAPAAPQANGSPRVKIFTKASDQAHLCLGVPSYPLAHPDRYALQILSTVLGTGMSSRLFTEVRERRGLAYYIYAINHSYTDAGSLFSQAGVDIERIDEAITTIVAELRKITDEAVPSDELEKARNVAKGRFVLQTESPHGLVMYGLRREVLEGVATEPEEVLAGLDAVTVEDVQRVAQDVLGGHGLNLALIGPFEQDQQEHFEKLLAG